MFEMLVLHLTVPKDEIFYISWNLDACEGLGILQTDDAKNGKVRIFAPKMLYNDIIGFVDGIKAEGVDVTIDKIEGM